MEEKKVNINKIDTIEIGLKGYYLFRKKDDGFYIVINGKEHKIHDKNAIEVLKEEFNIED